MSIAVSIHVLLPPIQFGGVTLLITIKQVGDLLGVAIAERRCGHGNSPSDHLLHPYPLKEISIVLPSTRPRMDHLPQSLLRGESSLYAKTLRSLSKLTADYSTPLKGHRSLHLNCFPMAGVGRLSNMGIHLGPGLSYSGRRDLQPLAVPLHLP
nr:hypothetical protein HmN_000916100 [Hymenolepis microstoma]